MHARDAIKISIDVADMIWKTYLDDLTDEEMMHRPHPGCNHIKWQIGHLVSSDNEMVNGCLPGTVASLPDGFADRYSKEQATNDDPNAFHSKAELMDLFTLQRQASMAALANLSDAELAKPAPESMQSYAPTVGAAFSMLGTHWTMHSGQWVVVRRQLGREVII